MADVVISIRGGVAIANIAARNGVNERIIGAKLGVDLPKCAGWNGGAALMLIGYAPGCWMAFAEPEPDNWIGALTTKLEELASVTDQSAAYTILRLTGGECRRLLQRGLALDLHQNSFTVHSAAITQIAHVGVIVWQVDAAPTFDLAIPRSYTSSFLVWLNNEISLSFD